MSLDSAERLFIRIVSSVQPFVLLLVRVSMGYDLMITGWGHLHHIDVMTERFTKWGIPFPHQNVILSGTFEMVGGALWILGFFTRGISLALVFNFLVALGTAGRENVLALFGKPEFDPSLIVEDAAWPFLLVSLILLVFGPGWVSIDAIVRKLFLKGDTIQTRLD